MAHAVTLSTFGKGIALLTVVWDYDVSYFYIINAIVLSSNTVALRGNRCCYYYYKIFRCAGDSGVGALPTQLLVGGRTGNRR